MPFPCPLQCRALICDAGGTDYLLYDVCRFPVEEQRCSPRQKSLPYLWGKSYEMFTLPGWRDFEDGIKMTHRWASVEIILDDAENFFGIKEIP